MSQLFETIQIKDGSILNLKYHQDRFDFSRKQLFPNFRDISLAQKIHLPSYYQVGLIKCRISYSEKINEIVFEHYSIRQIKSIKKVHHDKIDYSYKFENRKILKTLFNGRQGHQEILIIKNGLVTDCFYYNVAFFDGHKWLTPEKPLLKGTKRAFLLDHNKISLAPILEKDIPNFHKIALFNALSDFGEVQLSVDQIF